MKTRTSTHRCTESLHSTLSTLLAAFRPVTPAAPPEQLTLGLDVITESGLSLRDAIVVRSAEYWLQLSQPERALQELQSLPESARQHGWPLRVQLRAVHSAGSPCS